MFGGNLGLHVIQFPSGKFGYVGAVPHALVRWVPATISDVMGQRAVVLNGATMGPRSMVFDTEAAAVDFAREHGFDAKGATL